jgi:hypothetical protein
MVGLKIAEIPMLALALLASSDRRSPKYLLMRQSVDRSGCEVGNARSITYRALASIDSGVAECDLDDYARQHLACAHTGSATVQDNWDGLSGEVSAALARKKDR